MAQNPSVIVDFVANTAKMAEGIKQLGGASDQAAGQVKKVDWKRIALWGGAAAGLAAGTKFVKDATQETEALAKASMQLSRTTGMDTQTASQWVEVAKSRNIQIDTLNKSFVILSKQMNAAAGGSKTSAKAFKQLGVSMDDVRKGDTQKVIMEVSDGLAKMHNPARQAALMQQMFGRSSASLAPIMYKGSAAIQDQLAIAHKYGAEIGDNTTKNVAQMAQDEREMGMAMDGVKITLGTALIPILADLSKMLLEVTQVTQPLIANATLMKIAIGALVVAFIAYKVAAIAAAVASSPLIAALGAITAPVWITIAAIAALIAIGVLLYKNWDTVAAVAETTWNKIKAGISAVIDWIKKNWPLLVGILAGPFGVAVALIVTHWNTAKSVISGFIGWFTGAWDTVKSMLNKVAGWFDIPLQAAKDMVNGIKTAINGIDDAITGAIAGVRRAATSVADAIKAPINAIIGGWNSLEFSIPKINVPKIHIPHVGDIGGGSFGGQTFGFPKIPKLAAGGVVDVPTLALIGEGQGREIVTPESLLRQIVAQMVPVVHVYIGDTELKDIVRVEATSVDNATAASLMAGLA